MSRKRTSPVWEFFELMEVDVDGKKTKKAICKLCDGLKLAYGGGTTNLLNHLEAKYPVSYKNAVPVEASVQKKQTTLGVFQAKTCPPAQANTITALVAEFVSRDLRPLSIVDGKGFQQLLGYMEPGYKVLSRPHVATTCRRLHTSLKEQLIETISSQEIAVTTDLWTSRAIQGYLTITAHFINSEWRLENKVLLTQEMAERHTGEHIVERLQDAMKEYKVDEQNIVAVVRDNARNMQVAVDKLGWEDVPCFAHTLQLAVTTGLDLSQVSRLTAVGRKVVGHFKHSVVAMTSLNHKQQQLNLPQHHRIQDVATRWNSTYFMMERLLEQRWAVLHDDTVTQSRYRSLNFSEDQWKLLEQMLTVLSLYK